MVNYFLGKYAFTVDNTSLQLFNVVNGDGGEFIDKPESTPFLTLTRIDEEKK